MQRRVYMSRFLVILVAMLAAMSSCVMPDEYAPKQRTQIEKYLDNNSLEYVITSDSAYVHLAGNKFGYIANDRGSQMADSAEKGDNVTFNVEAYEFSSSPAGTPYYTNKQRIAEAISSDLDTSYWNFDPYVVTLGRGEILKSLDEALVGSLVGDSIAVFMTSSIAYGAMGMGVVPANTAVMMVLTIEELTKKK